MFSSNQAAEEMGASGARQGQQTNLHPQTSGRKVVEQFRQVDSGPAQCEWGQKHTHTRLLPRLREMQSSCVSVLKPNPPSAIEPKQVRDRSC